MKELHRFIQQLDNAEKKYFRRYGLKDGSKGDSLTKSLFNLLEETAEYDEEKIHNRIRRLKLNKQLAHTKAYLFDLLTETITWYHRSRFAGLNTSYQFAQIQLLDEKGLQAESVKMLAKFLKQTLREGIFTDKWQALNTSIHHNSNSFISNKKIELQETNELLQERLYLLQQMQTYHAYDSLLVQQLAIIRKAMQARSADDLKALNVIFENELIQDVTLANSYDARFTFHTIRIQHFTTLGKMSNVLTESEELLMYYKKNLPAEFTIMRVLWIYASLTQACHFTQQWEKLSIYLDELLQVKTKSRVETAAKFNYHTQLAISLFDHQKNITALNQLLSSATQKLKEYKHELRADIRLATVITCTSAFVEYGKYNEAIDLCEGFLTDYDRGIRLDALLMLYAYELISHLELGNTLYVNNVVQNVNRYFVRNDYKGNFETTLLKIFRKLSETGTVKLKPAEIKDLAKELEQSTADVSSPQNLALLPIIQSYLEKKLR